ncbi:MAG: ABC transporter ATP-binding protein [Lachnospirales bacterium]
MLEVKNITKLYKIYNAPMDRLKESLFMAKNKHIEFYALTDVSFNVKKGEILGIMGKNGAGKSTLLKIISGVLTQTMGTVKLEGRVSSLLELGTGFNLELSGIENIYFYCTIYGFTKKEIDNKLQSILEFAEIGDFVYQPVKTYSSGMFARLAFACAISIEPEVLIVDEILSVGDIRFQSKCFNKFKEFKENGITILYVGHDIGTMRTFCDTCIWLNNGKIVEHGDPTYVSSKYVEFMYLEETEELTNYKKHEEKDKVEDKKEDKKEDKVELVLKDSIENSILESKPLAHWGTIKNLIHNIRFTDKNGENIEYCLPHQIVNISFEIRESDLIDYEHFSIAFSIKNIEGTDLIVKTTYDQKIKLDKSSKKINFELELPLNIGQYYIVLALEDRRNAIINYYEYIEGAKYFKVYSDKELYGVFLSNAKITLN